MICDNNESINNKTQYYSARSNISIANPTGAVDNSYRSSMTDESLFKISQLDDSFDSMIEDNKELYNKNDYIAMKQLIKNEDFGRLKDLQTQLLKEEIERRKASNIKRLNKLSKLQDKMYNLEKKTERHQ
jgi:hypothetical protein